MIKMDKKSKRIYGLHDGMTYEYLDKKSWVPCINMPVSGMVPLCRKAYPILYQGFAERVSSNINQCLAIRLQCGVNQEEFAKLMGMTQQAISRLERGTRQETKIHKRLLHYIEKLNDEGLL